jgi:hypothetical protein
MEKGKRFFLFFGVFPMPSGAQNPEFLRISKIFAIEFVKNVLNSAQKG